MKKLFFIIIVLLLLSGCQEESKPLQISVKDVRSCQIGCIYMQTRYFEYFSKNSEIFNTTVNETIEMVDAFYWFGEDCEQLCLELRGTESLAFGTGKTGIYVENASNGWTKASIIT